MQANRLWSLWQALVLGIACGFATAVGRRRFVEWVTVLALNVEEHTVTQSLVGLDRARDWKALESFVEYGSWPDERLPLAVGWAVEQAPGRLWHGYRVWAGDDTKVHRTSKDVWGTCTYHEYTARCPNRATTVRAHNWVVLGALLDNPGQPAWFLPVAGRLYFRKAQMPPTAEVFRTKCELLVELARQQARELPGPHLLVCDGGYALGSVVRPLVRPDEPAGGGTVLRPLPPGGRLPRPQAAPGLGGRPGVDQAADPADDPGVVRDPDGAAAVAVRAGASGGGRRVAAPALESGQGAAERAGRGAVAAPPPRGDSALSGGLAGGWRKGQSGCGSRGGYVSERRALVGQQTASNVGRATAHRPAPARRTAAADEPAKYKTSRETTE